MADIPTNGSAGERYANLRASILALIADAVADGWIVGAPTVDDVIADLVHDAELATKTITVGSKVSVNIAAEPHVFCVLGTVVQVDSDGAIHTRPWSSTGGVFIDRDGTRTVAVR